MPLASSASPADGIMFDITAPAPVSALATPNRWQHPSSSSAASRRPAHAAPTQRARAMGTVLSACAWPAVLETRSRQANWQPRGTRSAKRALRSVPASPYRQATPHQTCESPNNSCRDQAYMRKAAPARLAEAAEPMHSGDALYHAFFQIVAALGSSQPRAGCGQEVPQLCTDLSTSMWGFQATRGLGLGFECWVASNVPSLHVPAWHAPRHINHSRTKGAPAGRANARCTSSLWTLHAHTYAPDSRIIKKPAADAGRVAVSASVAGQSDSEAQGERHR
eukprot:343245-Chlamydomonas_euryale.AAC.6